MTRPHGVPIAHRRSPIAGFLPKPLPRTIPLLARSVNHPLL